MTILNNTTLYHGSYTTIDSIDLNKCATGKDFGRGFYLTTSYEQACNFVPLSVRKREADCGISLPNEGYVSKYLFIPHNDLLIYEFEEANTDWLHFIAANRRNDIFTDLIEAYSQFDIVIGKIANDRTARTLQLYITGAFGEPGTKQADSIAIATLLPDRLENQFCFRSPRAIECLSFEGSDRYEFSS